MKIGDEVYVHGYVDEILKGTVIIRNDIGYFGTVEEEIVSGELRTKQDVDAVIDRALENIDKELNEFADSICKCIPHKEEEYMRVIIAMFMIRCKDAVKALKGEQE